MKYTGNYGLRKPDGTDIVNIEDLNANMDILDSEVAKKVDKVAGKQLSTENYTSAEKTKLAGIEAGANKYTHPSTHPASMITGGTLAGVVVAQTNTAYATRQVRNVIISPNAANSSAMQNGDIWIQYK